MGDVETEIEDLTASIQALEVEIKDYCPKYPKIQDVFLEVHR